MLKSAINITDQVKIDYYKPIRYRIMQLILLTKAMNNQVNIPNMAKRKYFESK